VDIVCLKQNIDTTLPAGRLTFQVLGAVAEFEREMLRERVKAGMAQARRSGKRIGRPARATAAQKRLSEYGRYEQKRGVFANWPKSLAPQWTIAKLSATPRPLKVM
jgi:DNA invertase Pin-like site-specific DNA recombinase